jgi:hypothetical protein
VTKGQIVLEIVTLLQGTPIDDFARANLIARDGRAIVKCAEGTSIATPEGQVCKRAIATALRVYSYRFTKVQLGVLADLYVSALSSLEPEALARVRQHMCDPQSEAAQRDGAAAVAVCERLSLDF